MSFKQMVRKFLLRRPSYLLKGRTLALHLILGAKSEACTVESEVILY